MSSKTNGCGLQTEKSRKLCSQKMLKRFNYYTVWRGISYKIWKWIVPLGKSVIPPGKRIVSWGKWVLTLGKWIVLWGKQITPIGNGSYLKGNESYFRGMDRTWSKWIAHYGNGLYIKVMSRTFKKVGRTRKCIILPPKKQGNGKELGPQSELQAPFPTSNTWLSTWLFHCAACCEPFCW